ncbi:MAG: hypothetical protein H0V04_02155 [Chloroflexi bacterium]|nr:hypothetical protein [Chloroflexota bacterium]HEV8054254.1 hypothetical protein [Candidatus Limnocylindrales bacterium]
MSDRTGLPEDAPDLPRDDSDELRDAVQELRRLEDEKRREPMTSPGFLERARRVEEQARRVFRVAQGEPQSVALADAGDGGKRDDGPSIEKVTRPAGSERPG